MAKLRYPENTVDAYIGLASDQSENLARVVGELTDHSFAQISIDKDLYQQSTEYLTRHQLTLGRALRDEVTEYKVGLCYAELDEAIHGVCNCRASISQTLLEDTPVKFLDVEEHDHSWLCAHSAATKFIQRFVSNFNVHSHRDIRPRHTLDSRGCMQGVVHGRHAPLPRTVVKKYSGRVDVVDDEVFLVTIKNRSGKPNQLSFPLKMAIDSELQNGDFISYLILRDGDELTHEFRKETPELTAEEELELDQYVDELLGDFE